MIFASRWDRAFGDDDEVNHDLKATCCHRGIMQASDVAHTMQHGTFTGSGTINYSMRCSQPINKGRMGADPSTF
jgi:hypothetical protein